MDDDAIDDENDNCGRWRQQGQMTMTVEHVGQGEDNCM
jgi:hypothetical protein